METMTTTKNTAHNKRAVEIMEINGEVVEAMLCPMCGEWHPLADFYKGANGSYDNYCKSCRRAIARESYAKSKAKTTKADDGTAEMSVSKTESASVADIKRMIRDCKDFSLSKVFQPRELMLALKELGYEGELTYTEVHHIKLSSIS